MKFRKQPGRILIPKDRVEFNSAEQSTQPTEVK